MKHRLHKLYYNTKGDAYFMLRGRRYYLRDFMRDSADPAVGYYTTCNFGGVCVRIIDDYGDAVEVWEDYGA